jgi:type II secretory pathway component PulF
MFAGFLISFLIAALWNFVIGPAFRDVYGGMDMQLPGATIFALRSLQAIWAFPLVLGIVFLLALSIIFQPVMRGKFLWRMPAFKEANVARVASALTLLLKNGVSLPDAIGLVEGLEDNKRATADLQRWKEKLAAGSAKFSEVASASSMFPPMFVWIVSGAGEDLISGFRRAAEMYQSRAVYRTEVALFSVLPLASLFLGAIVMSQAFLVFSMFLPMLEMVYNLSGD